MAEYIKRDAFIAWLKRIPLKDLSDGLGLCRIIMEEDFNRAIRELPREVIADVTPVVHGRWLTWEEMFPGKTPKKKNNLGVFCNSCKNHADNMFDFCPNCGARMDGDAERRNT